MFFIIYRFRIRFSLLTEHFNFFSSYSKQESTSASIGELLRHNHENTVKINKILNILAAKKQTDSGISDYLLKRQDISEHVEQRHEDPGQRLRKVLQSSGSISTAQNIDRRTRYSSLGEVNDGFEDSEFPDTLTPRRNDMIVDIIQHRKPTLRRSSTVSIPAFNFLATGAAGGRSLSFARRFIHFNRKDSHASNGSISL